MANLQILFAGSNGKVRAIVNDDPNAWYKAALKKKHESQLLVAQILFWLPRAAAFAAIAALIIIAVRV